MFLSQLTSEILKSVIRFVGVFFNSRKTALLHPKSLMDKLSIDVFRHVCTLLDLFDVVHLSIVCKNLRVRFILIYFNRIKANNKR